MSVGGDSIPSVPDNRPKTQVGWSDILNETLCNFTLHYLSTSELIPRYKFLPQILPNLERWESPPAIA
jgi:hypothetical protein